jgi:hypothetical protein
MPSGSCHASVGGDLMQQLVHGPIEVVIGVSFGIGWGILLIYFPHKDDVSIHEKPKVSGLKNSNVYFPA